MPYRIAGLGYVEVRSLDLERDVDYYTQDFVQNDPFLRAPVIFMLSRGREADEKLLRERFPRARLAREAPYGQVWRLD